MVTCPVCFHQNHEFALLCDNCKAFLQNRVRNLDLIETLWGIVHAPRRTFRKIALADHKNYTLLLFGLSGISIMFSILWYYRLGDRFSTLFDLLLTAVGGGVLLGLILAATLSLLYHALARLLGGTAPFRSSMATLAYAFFPLILSLVLVLPIELLTFGMYLFTWNPSPYVINPVSFVILVGLDALSVLWMLVLATVGTAVVHSIPPVRAIVVILSLVAAVAVLLVATSGQAGGVAGLWT